MENAVGPVLRMCDEVEFVIQAIKEDNSDTPVEVIDRGAYIRVQAPRYLRLRLETLERHLGQGFEMRQIEAMLASFAGRITTSSSEIIWQFKN